MSIPRQEDLVSRVFYFCLLGREDLDGSHTPPTSSSHCLTGLRGPQEARRPDLFLVTLLRVA